MQSNFLDDLDPIPAWQGGKPEPARMPGQRGAILDRLRQGRASNVELNEICLRYSARIHELRQAGYSIAIVSQDRETGVTVYELNDHPRA